MTTRRRFTGDFKARVALEALRGDKTVQEVASKHKVHPNQVSTWKRQAIEGLGEVFSNGPGERAPGSRGRGSRASRQDRPADDGTGFFGRRAQAMSRDERKAMIAPG